MNKQTLISYLEAFPERGDRPALFFKTGFRTLETSFKELHVLALRISVYLDRLGLKKGDRIVLWGANSPDWVATLFACVLKGLVAVPLDIRGSTAFTKKIFKFTEASLLICDHTKISEAGITPSLDFEHLRKKAASIPVESAQITAAKPSDTVEILFTSGTTDEPKGVALSHENIVSNVESLHAFIPEWGNVKLLSLLPLSHIFEQAIDLWLPLSQGGSVTYLKILTASSIFGSLEEDGITVAPVVPRLLDLLKNGILREVQRQRKEKIFHLLLRIASWLPIKARRILFPSLSRKLGKLKYFFVGGATLEPAIEQFWESLGVPLIQGYGLTETSPVISCNQPRERRFGSIGKILPGVKTLLSPEKEIWVSGKNVFLGYYRNPEKTREVFEDGWFKTGDLGEFDNDGFLYFRGRLKDVIVTAEGLNIYPEDLEAVLHAAPEVKDCCVLGLKKGDREVVHAVLIPQDPASDLKLIMDQANAQLADYQKIQSCSLWPSDDFPRTVTMKVKKNEVFQCLQKDGNFFAEKKETEKPASPIYSMLAQLAKMPVDAIHPESRLGDDLGLSSLDRVEFAAMFEEEFHLDLDETLLAASTQVKQIEEFALTKPFTVRQRIPKWPIRPWIRALRGPFQDLLVFPIVRFFCHYKVAGLENLRELHGPVIFIANHTSYFDGPVIFMALPRFLREKMAPATWKGFFDSPTSNPLLRLWKKFEFYYASIAFNIYLFDTDKDIKRSLEHTGWLLDRGFNILLFPEAARTLTGEMDLFKPGIGMITSTLQVPVVPVGIKGLFEIFPRGKKFPRRGEVTIRFGKPFFFAGESRNKIIGELQKKVSELIQ